MAQNNFLHGMILQSSGADLTESPLPIPSDIGEGFRFSLNGKRYVTSGERTKEGKRKLQFDISTFRGISFGAIHYYCLVYSYISNRDIERGGCVCGYLGGIKIPRENESIRFEICRCVTQEEINKAPERWRFYQAGDLTNAFESMKDLEEAIAKVKQAFSPMEWEFIIKDFT